MTWERALEADARLAAKNAVLIRAALRQSFDPERAFIGYQATTPDPKLTLPQQRSRARSWAMINLRINLEPLKQVIEKVWVDALLLGDLAAQEAILESRKKQKADVAGLVDWSKWKPGDEAAALVAKKPGLLQLLRQAQGFTWKSFSDTTLTDIGNSIGEAIALGLDAKRSAKLIRNHVASPARALTIAITEQNRAISYATTQRYRDAGLEKMEWLVFEPCQICKQNANVIVQIGQPFPSGDQRPPAHPNCRCALGPVIPGFNDRPVTINDQPIDTPSMSGITETTPTMQTFANKEEVLAEAKKRAARPTKIDVKDYTDKPDARTYDTDRAMMGEIMQKQGWDAPSLSLSPEEFDEIAKNPGNYGYRLFFRGGPDGLSDGFIEGKPFIGDGNAGPGIYVTNRVDRAGAYASLAEKNTGGSEVVQILIPNEMINEAPNRSTWTGSKNPLPAPINGMSRADTIEIAADGLRAYSSEVESTAGDYVIYDPSSIIVRRNK